MKTFVYTISGKRSLGLIIVRCRTLAFAIHFVQARMTEDLGKAFFADEKDFVVFEKDFEGVVWSDCGDKAPEVETKVIELNGDVSTQQMTPQEKTVLSSFKRQNVV